MPRLARRTDERVANRAAFPEPVDITIRTRVPSKWRFVDQETGEVWRWDYDQRTFVRATV
jgi:hypothetical protein